MTYCSSLKPLLLLRTQQPTTRGQWGLWDPEMKSVPYSWTDVELWDTMWSQTQVKGGLCKVTFYWPQVKLWAVTEFVNQWFLTFPIYIFCWTQIYSNWNVNNTHMEILKLLLTELFKVIGLLWSTCWKTWSVPGVFSYLIRKLCEGWSEECRKIW